MRPFQPDDVYLPAAELARRIHACELSPVDVVDSLTVRIEKLNPKLNAFVHLDLRAARKEAEQKEAHQRREPHRLRGPLFGVPVAVKDDLAVKGMPVTHGSRVCATTPADYDDGVVERLKAAGAIVLGKTHEPEFGHQGTTVNRLGPGGGRLATANPWDLSRTAGGSSGGSAAAVAAGLAYLAIGTDIGGSVRIPASCCGVVGLKPTFGVIPRVPSGNAFSFWVSGPITRSVGDAALLMRVLAQPHPGDRFNLPVPDDHWSLAADRGVPRVLWCPSPFGGPVEREVLDALRRPLEVAHAKKAIALTEADQPLLRKDAADELWSHFITLAGVDLLGYATVASGSETADDLLQKEMKLSPTFVAVAKAAGRVDLTRYLAAQAAVTKFCEEQAVRYFTGCDLDCHPGDGRPALLQLARVGANRCERGRYRPPPGLGTHLAVQLDRRTGGVSALRMDEQRVASGSSGRGQTRPRRPRAAGGRGLGNAYTVDPSSAGVRRSLTAGTQTMTGSRIGNRTASISRRRPNCEGRY